MLTILVVVLLVLLIAGHPGFGWHSWGYYPSGGLGIVLLILVILLLTGRV